MNKCLHHKDEPADFVCTVCFKYFCNKCVSVRDYTGYICHHCSGEKPSDPEPDADSTASPSGASDKQSPNKPVKESRKPESESLVSPGVEWVVLAVCVVLASIRLITSLGDAEAPLELASNKAEDLSVYCLGKLDEMEYQGANPDLLSVKSACPYPIEVEEVDFGFLVKAPDAYVYGFGEIEVELEPMTITIMDE